MPKKRKTNRSQYNYDPRYAEGYAILNNLPAAQEALGDVLSAYRKVASKLDAESNRRNSVARRKNATQEEEDKRLQSARTLELREQLTDSDLTLKNPYEPQSSIGGAFAQYQAKRFNDARRTMPEGYGLSDFFSDQWNFLLREMNKNQADEAVGLQVRAENDKSLIRDYNTSLDKLDEIESIDFRLGQINDISRKGLTRGQLNTLNDEINQLISRKRQLLEEYLALAPRRKQLELIVNRNSLSAAVDRTLSGNGIFGSDAWWNPAGKTTAIHDELNDARRFLYDLGNGNRSRLETRAQLLMAIQEYDNLNKGWNAIIDENRAALEQYDKKVTGWFKGRESRANIEFFDPDTYLFKFPGILGGSASSYMKQIPAMAAGIVAGIVAAPMVAATSLPTIAGGVGALAAGMGTSFAFNQGAGRAENNVEVANAAIERIKDRTGLSEGDIRNVLSGKLTDPRKLRKITENIKSVENLFNTDMAATTWDSAIDAALSVVPVGALSKLSRFAKATKPVKKVLSNPKVLQALSSRFGSDFVQGYNLSDITGPVGGIAGGLINATAGRVAKNVGNFVVRPTRGKLGKLAEGIEKKISGLGRAAAQTDPEEILLKKSLKNGTRTKYIKDIGGRLVKSALTEGVEEGKQHINAENFKSGAMDSEIKGMFDIGLNDMIAGYTSGAYMMGIPLDALGIIDIKDQDLLQEIKGGMLGGWGQTTAVNVIRETVPYIQELRANEIVAEALAQKKLESQATYKQYQNWLRTGLLSPNYNTVSDAFNRLREMNNTYKQTNGEEGITEDEIKEAEADYKRVISIAHDPLTKALASALGIKVRTLSDPTSWKSNSEYRDFVALKAMAETSLNEKQNLVNDAMGEREAVERQLSLAHIDEYDQGAAYNIGMQDEVPGKPQSAYVEPTSYNGELDLTKVLAKLAAMLKYREQLEKGLEILKDNKNARVRRGLKKYLERLDRQIDTLSRYNESLFKGLTIDVGDGLVSSPNKNMSIHTLKDVEENLVFNKEEHDLLRDAYEQELKAQLEYENAAEDYLNIVGKLLKVDEKGDAVLDIDTDWDPRKDLSRVSFTGGNAKSLIKSLREMDEEDDNFEAIVEEIYLDDLRAKHLADENGINRPTVTPERPSRPVLDGNGDQIHVTRTFGKKIRQESPELTDEIPGVVTPFAPFAEEEYDDLLYIDRQLAPNEYVDQFGMLWEYVDDGPKNPFAEAAEAKNRYQIEKEDFDNRAREAFLKVWSQYTGSDTVPAAQDGAERRAYEEVWKQLIDSAKEKAAVKAPVATPPEDKKPSTPQVASSAIVLKNPQEETLEWLDNKLKSDKKNVMDDKKGYHTTGQDYFIKLDDKVVRTSRVHSVKPASWIRPEEEKARKEITEDLVQASGALDDLLKRIEEYKKVLPDFDSTPYVKYLKENEQEFFANPTQEQSLELRRTIESISRLLASRKPTVSVDMGNILDELARVFFGSPNLYNLTSTELGIDQLFDSVNEYTGRTYRNLFDDYKPSFNDIIQLLRTQYKYYTEDLGWDLRTEGYTWRAEFGAVGWVAGQTDMIGVDKLGLMHIVDFKTSYQTFGEKQKSYVDPNTGKEKTTTTIPFRSVTRASDGQILSPYDDYTNQLTIYAEMVAFETGNSVASIELLPFVCEYKTANSKVAKVEHITLEPRIPLTFNLETIQLLNAPTERTNDVVEELRTRVLDAYHELQEKYTDFEERLTNDVYDSLSLTGKSLVDDLRSFMAGINLQDLDDIDAALNILNDITAALDTFLDVESLVFLDYATLLDKAAATDRDAANTETKNAHILTPTPSPAKPANQLQQSSNSGIVRATNKIDRTGGIFHTNIDYTVVERDKDLSLATLAPDFITSADIEVYTEGNYVYCNISYGGKTWKRINIRTTDWNGNPTPNGQQLYDSVKKLEGTKKPGQRIVPLRSKMDRTDGAIFRISKNGEIQYQQIGDTDLFAGEDILDIEFSTAYKRLGYIDAKGTCVSFESNSTAPTPIYNWTYPETVPAAGTLIYLKHLSKDERDSDSIIPVALDRVKLQEDDIDFIISLLSDPSRLDSEHIIEHNGETVYVQATGRQLANLLIPIVDDSSKIGGAVALLRNPEMPNIVRLVNREDLNARREGLGTFDLNKPDGPNSVADLRKVLASRSITERHDVLATRLSSDTSDLLPFQNIKKFFNSQGALGNDITHIRISSSLSFDLEDFKIKKSKTGVMRQGISGFAYYLKHNLLRTQYAGMLSCNVGINDVTIEDKSNPIKTQPTGVNVLPLVPGANEQIPESSQEVYEDFLAGLNKTTSDTNPRRRLTEERARKNLAALLGDLGNDFFTFQDGFLEASLKTSANVIGRCKADAIILSSYAYPGVEYHEAFHRIFELLVDEKTRDSIYSKVAKRIDVQLYDENGNENKDSFRQVAEYIADKYMDHMTGSFHWENYKIPFLTKAWNVIRDFVKILFGSGNRDLYMLFAKANLGRYRNLKPNQKNIDRFNRLYGELLAQVHGVEFLHIMNQEMYDRLKETVVFCLLNGQEVDRTGRNIQEIGRNITKETFKKGVDKLAEEGYDIFGDKAQIPTVGQLAMKELYEKFDLGYIRDDIANFISILSTDFVKEQEAENIEEAQGDPINSSIGEHTRSSYEFSRFDKTTSRVRFFFATIPDAEWLDQEVIEDGMPVTKKVQKYVLNEFGLPSFVPVLSIYNEFLNNFYDVDTKLELVDRLERLALTSPIYANIKTAIENLYSAAYTKNGKRNADEEALLALFWGTIRANKHAFDIARSTSQEGEFGKATIVIQPTDANYNANYYPTRWGQMLVNGGTPILKVSSTGTLLINPRIPNGGTIFERLANLLSHTSTPKTAENNATYNDVGIKEWINNALMEKPSRVYLRLVVNGKPGYYSDPKNPQQLEVAKNLIVNILNSLGINFTLPELNYMLLNKYGSTDFEALARMFNSNDQKDSMTSFITFLRNVAPNGKLQTQVYVDGRKTDLEKAYSKFAFVRELANYKYQYRHSRDLLTVLAPGNNKFYQISDNNYITDIVRACNKRTQEFEEIKSDRYNYYQDVDHQLATGETPVYGSLLLERLTNDPNTYITFRNFVGFKTDKHGDFGSDYFEIARKEDYVAKASILQKGGMVLLTLSDKKTYGYIDGIRLPGLNYDEAIDYKGNTYPFNNLGDLFVIPQDTKSQIEPMLTYQSEVIDRFISYALSEYVSIKKADQDLDAMEKDGTKKSEVSNYYAKEQGAKFSSLIGVWVNDYKLGENGEMEIVGETFHSFNDSKKSRKENIREAEKYFFSKPRAEQEKMISRLLHKQLLKEIKTCESLGLIEKVGNSGNIFLDYNNVGFDSHAISAIYKSLIAKNGQPKDQISSNNYKALAVIIYISDISNKAIMSGQEYERVFSGNPSFYKWKYDAQGRLVDRTVDELKRLGGTVSTGANNYMELLDIPEKYMENGRFTGMYTCAQIDDELIESPLADMLEELFLYGELSQAVYLQLEDEAIEEGKDMAVARAEISAQVDAMSIEELKEALNPDTLKIVERKFKEAAESYRLQYKADGSVDDGINVADGAAYITDTMAEMLLRMNGSYGKEVENAFKILREEKPSTILQKHKAYRQIITSVIGSQKYTAFGRRSHPRTGIQVAYYNKMALFPIFKCLATGRLLNIYSKMTQQGIDMLMFDSAVKVGGQGTRPVKWGDFRQTSDEKDPQNHIDNNVNNPLKPTFDEGFEFDTYQQKFIYLRKQLNTDPKEEVMMGVGTQMTKVAMTALLDGRTYYAQDGTLMSGEELRNDIMNAINILSDRGYHTVAKRFFKTNEKGDFLDSSGNIIEDTSGTPAYKSSRKVLDVEKFAKEVRRMMSTKDPDANILAALLLVEQKDGNGNVQKHLRLPLNAVSNSKWMESILISSVNKEVIDIQTVGSTAIQRSVWAMEGSTLLENGNGSIISDEDMSLTINDGKRLQLVNEEGSMDCVLSVDMIKKMLGGTLPKATIKDENGNPVWDLVTQKDKHGNVLKDKDGKSLYVLRKNEDGTPMVDKNGKPVYKREIRTREMTFAELRNWLIKREIIGPDAKANIMGYRIPTQAGSSIHALRCVDIIPAVNDTVILPAEFTKTTGSDFDIDKLFLSFIQYKVSRNEGEDGKYHQTVSDKFKESDNAYYQNKLLRDYITLMLDWKSAEDHRCRTTNVQHRSIDNDTALLKNIIKDLEKGSVMQPESPYGFYSLSAQTASKNDYITGKVGIGPFALNNNNHVLTMMYHVRFKHIPSSIMSVMDLERLDKRIDKNGESIMSWISALINAHVDIAKDPYISRLNVNPFTYNLSNLLVRTGLGDKTFYFTTQPIMKALAEAYINAGSAYLADPWSSKYKLQLEAVDSVAEKWFEPLKEKFSFNGASVDNLITAAKEGGSERADLRKLINEHIKDLFDNELKNDAKSDGSNLENQLFYYLAYLQFDKYAKALSGLVQYSKIDTKKHGKSITEQLVYEQKFNETYDAAREGSLFEGEGLNKMLNDSYIGRKTENAISLTKDILAGQFIQCTPAFLLDANNIIEAIGRSSSSSATLFSKVSDALLAAIKSEFFNDAYVPSITDNPDFMHDLVSDSSEILEFKITSQGNVIQIDSNTHHPLSSYVRSGHVSIQYKGKDGKYHTLLGLNEDGESITLRSAVLGADDSAKTITISHKLPPMYGRIVLQGGRNTIYDRFWRLQSEILTNPKYRDLLDGNGQIKNRLLNMLVSGQTVQNSPSFLPGELPDTYRNAKFVKLFNFIEDKGTSANYIIDAWDALLQYTNQDKEAETLVRDFARDLIVYAFMTSGDSAGFTKIFKYVPASWRETSGYGKFINNRLIEYNLSDSTGISIEDVLLNNWFDNELVPTYKMKDRTTGASNFMLYRTKVNGVQTGFPTVLAALTVANGKATASIDPNNPPLVIKIQRGKSKTARDSQRKYTLFKFHSIAVSKDGVYYPVYIKVNPKGLQTSENFLITEYGRNDSVTPLEYTIDEQKLEAVYKASTVGDHVRMTKAAGETVYAAIVSGLARAYERERALDVSTTPVSEEENPSANSNDLLNESEAGQSSEHEQC